MNNTLKLLFLAALPIFLGACSDNSFNEIEGALLKEPNFSTSVYTATLSVAQMQQKAVQTNGLGGNFLGRYTQAPFGTKQARIVAQIGLSSLNPTFGAQTQANENKNSKPEHETVTEAYLYLPYFNPNSSAQKPTYAQNAEYHLDSIYGNKAATFKVAVNELDYYLSDIDADLNAKQYYSNNANIAAHIASSIVSATTTSTFSVSNKSIVRYQFDNPETTDDESKKVSDILAPGLRIPLSAAFFQSKIIDKEGSKELTNLNNFRRYFKGITITASDFSADLMMLLDIAKAKIEVVYHYDAEVKGATKKRTNRFEMPLQGISMNLIENTGANLTDTSKWYLSGALGQTVSITLSDAEIARFKSERWMITDASLLLYVDKTVSYAQEPERLYVYNAQTGGSLADYLYDPTKSNGTAAYSYLIHLPKLHKENNKGVYYRLRITNHLLNIISGTTSATNVPLGVAVASNVQNANISTYLDAANAKHKIPITTLATPLSTVIKDVKLEIHYTKTK